MPTVRAALVLAFVASFLSAQTAPPPPDLSLAINGSAAGTAYAGWPLPLRATVAISDDSATYDLHPALLTATIYGTDGLALDLVFARTSGPSGDVTLDGDNDIAAFTLYLSPDQTAGLAGSYVVNFSLGDLQISKPVTFSAEPATPPDDLASRKRFAWCDYQLATGDFQSALDLATLELSFNPVSLPAMSRSASALQGLGKNAEARQMLLQAMNAFDQQYPDATHPPLDLQRRYSALSTVTVQERTK